VRSTLFGITLEQNSTAVGFGALAAKPAPGGSVAVGVGALHSNTSDGINGLNNTAVGSGALASVTTGESNTAVGHQALQVNTGSGNIALGSNAGLLLTTGDSNIAIGHVGFQGESGTIRIGAVPFQTRTFIAGINGVNVGSSAAVLINTTTGQLGTMASSRRVKEEIRSMGEASDGLRRLRPVTFRYKRPAADGSQPRQYGLIAEEVAEVYPELVAYDATGQPATVMYHALPVLLLNELQQQYRVNEAQEAELERQHRVNQAQQAELETLAARLAELAGRLHQLERATSPVTATSP